MFCPKCASEIPDGTKVCPNCGLELESIVTKANETKAEISRKETAVKTTSAEKKKGLSVLSFLFFGLAIVVLVMTFIAANNISAGGNEIMKIQSVGGKTLEEAYYFELGSIYAGYAMLTRALGVSFAGIFTWMGIKA